MTALWGIGLRMMTYRPMHSRSNIVECQSVESFTPGPIRLPRRLDVGK